LKPNLLISENDLQGFINNKIRNKDIQNLQVTLRNGLIIVTGRLKWHGLDLPVEITGSLALDNKKTAVLTRVQKMALGPLRIPGFLYGALANRSFSLWPTPDWSMETQIKDIIIDNGQLIIQ
ncbi:MAG: hypothetical protein V1653_05105, partial [bacterium]